MNKIDEILKHFGYRIIIFDSKLKHLGNTSILLSEDEYKEIINDTKQELKSLLISELDSVRGVYSAHDAIEKMKEIISEQFGDAF